VAPNACVYVQRLYSTGPGNETSAYPYVSDNPGFPNDNGPYPVDTHVKWVYRYRGSLGAGNGFLHAWVNGTQVINDNNINLGTNTPGFPSDYCKIGHDDFQQGGGSGAFEMVRSLKVCQDAGYTEAQIRALLT
jgi:hypothetical protein